MECIILTILVQFIMFYSQCNTNANPIVGENVRLANVMYHSPIAAIVALCERNRTITNPRYFHDDILCTGTVITKTHILTSEHCSTDTKNDIIQIIVGSIDVRNGTRHNLMWWVTYQQWIIAERRRLRYEENDISIIKLLGLGVSDIIVPAVLSTANKRNLFGLIAMTAGWGEVAENLLPMILHEVTLRIIPDDECVRLNEELGETNVSIPKSEMCTIAEPYALIGCGDSGGPLLMGNTIVAVNIGVCPDLNHTRFHPRQANLHASVHFYRFFIRDNIRS